MHQQQIALLYIQTIYVLNIQIYTYSEYTQSNVLIPASKNLIQKSINPQLYDTFISFPWGLYEDAVKWNKDVAQYYPDSTQNPMWLRWKVCK